MKVTINNQRTFNIEGLTNEQFQAVESCLDNYHATNGADQEVWEAVETVLEGAGLERLPYQKPTY